MQTWQKKRDVPKSGRAKVGGNKPAELRRLAAPIRVGQAPAKLMLRINVSSFSGELRRDLSTTSGKFMSRVITGVITDPQQRLSRLRLRQIIEHAPKLAEFSAALTVGGEDGRSDDRDAEDSAAELDIAPLFEDDPAFTIDEVDVAKMAGALSSSARVAAAYDLWTALRWSRTTDSGKLVVEIGEISSVGPLLPTLLALDPCLELSVYGLGGSSMEQTVAVLESYGVAAGPRVLIN
jgi:hypothetical protein